MKKLLLGTALSLIFIAPAIAEEDRTAGANPPPVVEEHVDVKEPAPVAHEEKDMMVKDAHEDHAEVRSDEGAEARASVTEQEHHEEKKEVEASMDEVHHEAEASVEAPAQAHAHWGYTGAEAAPYWGNLDDAYHSCTSGKQQSPINISKFLQEDLPDISASYNPAPLSVLNNGHTIQVNYEAGSGFRADNVNYNLLQLHFHTPSEHYLDGAPYPMEVHFVHKASDGTLGVLGVMMKVGAHNPVIEGIWQNAPIKAGGSKTIESVKINAGDLLPESKQYYKYEGSLTTPPCTEGVQWHVLKDPIEISEKQLKAFQALFPVNARPVQPLNERVVTGD